MDWLSSFFDEVPSCVEQTLGYNSLPEYTSSSLHYSSIPKSHSLGLNGISIDSMVSLPEECSNESMYCSTTPGSAEFEHKPLTPKSDSQSIAEACDIKPSLFPRQTLFDSTSSLVPHINGHMENSILEKGRLDRQGCSTKSDSDGDRESGEF